MSKVPPIVIEAGHVESATREAQAWAARRNTHWALQLYTVFNCGLFVHCGPLVHCVARDPQNPDDLSRRQAEKAVMALWAQKGPNAAAGKDAHG
ncbi:hypothetical protein LGT41_0000800 [Abyssibius alkaniclasticus]|uniref:hypothetical protein n=1 Tax=Abyssibius alkaniclasticus TaxID=2881234 RepID=UPI002363BE74|nr:hypothetical protein [Abyssibius alkaniclasticus]UPH71384.1 hypothetical protein LGT41_0000800 [Abyssibius alkaniclasticus]